MHALILQINGSDEKMFQEKSVAIDILFKPALLLNVRESKLFSPCVHFYYFIRQESSGLLDLWRQELDPEEADQHF